MINVVLGLGYGDEGKGMVTDYLCSQTPPEETIVCRFTGGHQAGHTVQIGDTRHVFSNFGSGTLRGVDTYWSSHCTIDPVGIMNEYNKLVKINKFSPVLYINRKCPVVTPYDKAHGVRQDLLNNHSTCGVGHGATRQRELNNYKLNVFDIDYPEIFKTKVILIGQKYPWARGDMKQFYEAVQFMRDNEFIQFVDKTPYRLNQIYEGSQGLMLDKDIGFFPYVTHGNVGHQNLENLRDYPANFYFVTRAYATRHGNGPFAQSVNEEELLIKKDIVETNVLNDYQGEFKKGVLNMDVLKYALNKLNNIKSLLSYNNNLVITCMDHIDEPYQLIVDNIHQTFSKEDFIKEVSKGFKINFSNVFINSSPEGNLIKFNLEN